MPAGTYSTIVTYTAIAEGIPEQYTMQGFTLTQCTNMDTNENIVLMDTRDGKNYRVTKLADGNCWMTENLALDGGRTLTPEDSNVTENRTLPENIADGTPTSVDTPTIYSGISSLYTSECNTSYPDCVENTTKYGNLYNWNAATATIGIGSSTGMVYESICPKNWQLPNSSGNYSYSSLLTVYGLGNSFPYDDATVIGVQSSPLYFTLSGSYYDSPTYQGRTGWYWTRSAKVVSESSIYAASFRFFAENGLWGASNTDLKQSAMAVRCVFQGETIQNNMYMQDITTEMCSNLAESTATIDNRRTVIDGRDGKSYKISHLADGNCWMVSNLALDGGRTLQPTDTDVTFNVALPANITSGTSVVTEKQIVTNSGYDGNLYNFCSASLLPSTSNQCANYTIVAPSICPKRWKLPRASYDNGYGTQGNYRDLLVKYELSGDAPSSDNKVSQFESAPLYFTRTGMYRNNYLYRGDIGYYATNAMHGNAWFHFYYYSSGYGINYGSMLRENAISIRCVLGS